jgi:3-hydroxyacyl-[acyl-carrier-protein] dehydratase
MTDTTSATNAAKTVLDIGDILKILPHRFPFLLIDRVTEIVPRERIVALKNVTVNEPFFTGHFPEVPILPGVIMIECMAQAGAVLLLTELGDRDNKLVVFTGVERARFRRPVVPGDQLRIEVQVKSWRGTAGRMAGLAFVGEKKVAEATISCQVIARKKVDGIGESADGPGS